MKKVVFIGSSVCYGYGAKDNFGWSRMLAQRLEAEGWETENCAIGGERTAHILFRLQKDVIDKHPDVCFVGLGLANEGFANTKTDGERATVRGTFESNLYVIVEKLKKAGIRVVLGGLYPNNAYTPDHARVLKETEQAMSSWGVPVLHWFDALADENGRFREGLYRDPGHPNDEGYRVMYDCIPENIMEEAEKSLI